MTDQGHMADCGGAENQSLSEPDPSVRTCCSFQQRAGLAQLKLACWQPRLSSFIDGNSAALIGFRGLADQGDKAQRSFP